MYILSHCYLIIQVRLLIIHDFENGYKMIEQNIMAEEEFLFIYLFKISSKHVADDCHQIWEMVKYWRH